MKIITLTTVYNRREQTVSNLRRLLRAQACVKSSEFTNIIVDDNSTDGTQAAIEAQFPGAFIVLSSPGNLYWAGGMRFGFRQISEICPEYDQLFCYNDDVSFLENSLVNMTKRSSNDAIIVGATYDPKTFATTYGGRTKSSIFHPFGSTLVKPDGKDRIVDTLNFNAVLIPSKILDQVGFFREYFVHSQADIEFGMRVKRNGYQVIQIGSFVGSCSKNDVTGTSRDTNLSVYSNFQKLTSIKEQPIIQSIKFHRQYHVFWPLFVLLPFVKIIINRFIKHD